MQAIQTFFGKQKVDLIGVHCVRAEYFELALIFTSIAELIVSIILSFMGDYFFSSIVFSVITMLVGLIGFIFSAKRRIKATPVFIICFILVIVAMTIANIYELIRVSKKDVSGGFIVLLVVVFVAWLLKYVFTVIICIINVKLFRFASKKGDVSSTLGDDDYVAGNTDEYVPPQQSGEEEEEDAQGKQNMDDQFSEKDSAIII